MCIRDSMSNLGPLFGFFLATLVGIVIVGGIKSIAKVTEKKIDPYWVPPESVREEDPSLPKVVAPGEDNPLGTRAIYLSMPSYLIHGTNKPYGVGMKVSHGCIRMYPEHVEKFYDLVQIGTKVNIIDQPIKAGWDNEELYIEVHSLPKYVAEDKSINVNDRKYFCSFVKSFLCSNAAIIFSSTLRRPNTEGS